MISMIFRWSISYYDIAIINNRYTNSIKLILAIQMDPTTEYITHGEQTTTVQSEYSSIMVYLCLL